MKREPLLIRLITHSWQITGLSFPSSTSGNSLFNEVGVEENAVLVSNFCLVTLRFLLCGIHYLTFNIFWCVFL